MSIYVSKTYLRQEEGRSKKLDRLEKFWKLALKLKLEERRGWRERIPIARPESVADHSFAVAIMTLFEAEQRNLEVEKALKLALLHDLEEAVTGDLTPSKRKLRGEAWVKSRKKQVIRQIIQMLPRKVQSNYQKLWKDLAENRSPEAELVHQLDKLEMAFQASEYARKTDRRQLTDFYQTAGAAISDNRLRKTLRTLAGRPTRKRPSLS